MLDFEYAKALAEVVLDTTCSEKEREVRLECLTQIFVRANAYLKKGFLPDVVEAFFVRKMEGLPLVSTKQDMQDFLKVSTPHFFGGKFTVSNIPYYSEEEELLLWSETCVIVSNTIDNALRECQLMKADNPQIECLVQLKARKIKGFLSIICENSLRENQADVLRGNSVMETSKEDKKNHGFGVKNIKRVVREYGGEVSFNVVDDMFSVSVLIPIEV